MSYREVDRKPLEIFPNPILREFVHHWQRQPEIQDPHLERKRGIVCVSASLCVCVRKRGRESVCAYVCEREMERARERDRERDTDRAREIELERR